MYLLFPFLLCLFPIHTAFAENIAEIDINDYIRTCLWCWGIVILGIAGFNYFTPNFVTAELCFTLDFFLLLYANYVFIGLYSAYRRSQQGSIFLFRIYYLLLTFLLSWGLCLFCPEKLAILMSKILFWTSLSITAFIIPDIIKKYSLFRKNPFKKCDTPITFKKDNRPDIYHIITDSHCGFAIPEYCDESFKQGLIERGFYIYKNAQSNYDMTYCSIPSCLNMDYVHNMVKSDTSFYPQSTLWKFYGQNALLRNLKHNGYDLDFAVCEDLAHLTKNNILKIFPSIKFIQLLLFSSIFFVRKTFRLSSLKSTVFKVFKSFERLLYKKNKNPRYILMHFLAPHEPFFVTEDGEKIKDEGQRDINNYLTYQKFINKELLKLIDKLKSRMKKNSIIIIHGDHSIHGFNENSHKILLSCYFPPNIDPKCIKENQSLVNLFKNLCNEVFGTEHKELEHEAYNVAWGTGSIIKVDNSKS